MILVDLSQVTFATLFAQVRPGKGISIEEDLLRHMILNVLRANKQKFGAKYGRLVLCVDNKNYWRKDEFPYYKYKRKKDRDESGIDWSAIFNAFEKIREEIKHTFPYQVINVPRAEADDVIGVVSRITSKTEKVLILSGDKDFGQLQVYPNIDQYAPVQKHWVQVDQPVSYLRMHIMRGDIGDGIPNFLSADDVFVKEVRQTPLQTKKLEQWCEMLPEKYCTTPMLRGFRRNEKLIDLSKIPAEIVEPILEEYEKPYDASRSRIFPYFIKHRMKLLMENINEF
jgi:Kyanoviridae ribonuclease H